MRTLRLSLTVAAVATLLPLVARAQEWTALTSGVTNDLNDIACVDDRTCYVVGGAPFIGGPGIVLKTTNGGDAWTAQTIPTTNPLRGISCPTATTCYAAGDGGTILKTTDGGGTWVRQSVPNLSTFPGQAQPWFWDIWAPSTSTAVAVGNVGAVYRTTNGGDTWTQLVLGLESHNLSGVFFVNATAGWLVGAPGFVHKTSDGGATWTGHATVTPSLGFSDVFSRDGSTVWASGPFTFVAKSTNGGLTWSEVSVPPAGGFPAVTFLDASIGWMGGNGGYLSTTDGGATWGLTFTGKFERGITCPSTSVCYMVGDDGTMRRYNTTVPATTAPSGTPTSSTDTPPAATTAPPAATSAPSADLTVGERALSCPPPDAELEFAEYRYRVVVRNIGTAGAGASTVRIEGLDAAGSVVGTPITRLVAALAGGGSTTVDGQVNVGLLNPTAAATATVRITVDALEQISESDEANNIATITQTCTLPTAKTGVMEPKATVTTPVVPTSGTAGEGMGAKPEEKAGTVPATTPKTEAMTTPTEAEKHVAVTPIPADQPKLPPVPPEEKRALEEMKRAVQLEKIQLEAPTILLGIEKVVEKKAIARDLERERLAAEKVELIAKVVLPTVPTERAEEVQAAMKAFIAYGAPTKAEVLHAPIEKLGEGERAGVVNSYTEAFGKLPETADDWGDVMKIAVGRFPSKTSAEREKAAEETFAKIYKRAPVRVQANDNACVVVIAYGLRPETRRLASEAAAIKTYKSVFKRAPKNASDWDAVRCIAYSGAKR